MKPELKRLCPDAKVALAKELLIAATVEKRALEQAARAADACCCGHRRDQHTISTSINYTGGFCMVCPEVKGHSTCHNFMMSAEPHRTSAANS